MTSVELIGAVLAPLVGIAVRVLSNRRVLAVESDYAELQAGFEELRAKYHKALEDNTRLRERLAAREE